MFLQCLIWGRFLLLCWPFSFGHFDPLKLNPKVPENEVIENEIIGLRFLFWVKLYLWSFIKNAPEIFYLAIEVPFWGPNLDTSGRSGHIEGVKMALPVLRQKIRDPFYNSIFSIYSTPKMRTKTFDSISELFWIRF